MFLVNSSERRNHVRMRCGAKSESLYLEATLEERFSGCPLLVSARDLHRNHPTLAGYLPACATQLWLHELSVGCCSFMCRAYLTGTFVSFASGRRVLIMEKRFLDVHFDYVVRFHVQIAGR